MPRTFAKGVKRGIAFLLSVGQHFDDGLLVGDSVNVFSASQRDEFKV